LELDIDPFWIYEDGEHTWGRTYNPFFLAYIALMTKAPSTHSGGPRVVTKNGDLPLVDLVPVACPAQSHCR
jgi:hypothetical protein